LIYGAAGSIGTWTVQLASSLGAEVTAVDSTAKLETLRSLGADHVIDYTQEDFTQQRIKYDVIIDVVGKSSYGRSLKCLKSDGNYVLANAPASHLIRSLWSRWTVSQQVRPVLTGYTVEAMQFLKQLIEDGKIKAVVHKQFPFEEIVAAHHFVESGEKIGNVVLKISNESP
jgi:NADPH:quinone reductase-like Zn-dependent oxidoreductase